MTQRNLAGLLAAPLLIGLWIFALVQPLPYVTFRPGPTLDVLGEADGQEIIQVDGHKTYAAEGQLRMTTVRNSQPGARVSLVDLMEAWISRDDAVYPYDVVYGPDETRESNEKEGEEQMVSSQHLAAAVALNELGFRVTEADVADVEDGSPADGRLEKGDVILEIDGAEVRNALDVITAVQSASGKDVELVVRRDGKRQTVAVSPGTRDGAPYLGIDLTTEVLPLPSDVEVTIPEIGGPSAGLMLSLGIYDTLTPGSMTDGATIAGTGEIDSNGQVGSIGGIQQKIAAARETDAELFLVPAGNCDDALGARNDDLTLVRADTMHGAAAAIEAWVEDPNATLPTCEEVLPQ
jgi:Lon-like protease